MSFMIPNVLSETGVIKQHSTHHIIPISSLVTIYANVLAKQLIEKGDQDMPLSSTQLISFFGSL